jgi:hypothetical protein
MTQAKWIEHAPSSRDTTSRRPGLSARRAPSARRAGAHFARPALGARRTRTSAWSGSAGPWAGRTTSRRHGPC